MVLILYSVLLLQQVAAEALVMGILEMDLMEVLAVAVEAVAVVTEAVVRQVQVVKVMLVAHLGLTLVVVRVAVLAQSVEMVVLMVV
jgi:hypothetical protein